MNVNDLFPSRFLKAHDLGGKAFTLTIRDITLENVGHGAEQERKLTLAFEKATKMMLLNRTNAMIIASLYGPETDAWKGKTVTVYSARIKAFGAWHDALRIKEQVPARNVGAAKMTEAMQEDPPLDDENDLLDVDEGDEPRFIDPDTGEIVTGKPPAQDAAQPTQTGKVTPGGGKAQDDASQAHQSPPHQRLFGQLTSGFGPDADDVRPWLITKWTKLVSPESIRTSATELSDTEKDLLADYIKDNLTVIQRVWRKYKAAQVQATETAKVTA